MIARPHNRPGNNQTVAVAVPLEGFTLTGDLCVPAHAKGMVVFAHGSGSSRLSPRNRYVAEVLQGRRVGTLLIDLLTPGEEAIDQMTRRLRFDIPMLAGRLAVIGQWVRAQPSFGALKLGYFGASTGGAAALIAAARQPDMAAAVVSRGGRPDLAMDALPQVKAATLLLVGEHDSPVLAWNREALERLNGESRLEIIPGATHLFEEPGAGGRGGARGRMVQPAF